MTYVDKKFEKGILTSQDLMILKHLRLPSSSEIISEIYLLNLFGLVGMLYFVLMDHMV